MIDLRQVRRIATEAGIASKVDTHGQLILYDSRGKPYIYVQPNGRAVHVITYDGRGRHRAALAAGAETQRHQSNPNTGFRSVRIGDPLSARRWVDSDLDRLRAGRADRSLD